MDQPRITKFASDYRSTPHPSVISAVMSACSNPSTDSYGEDAITGEAISVLRSTFNAPSNGVLFVSNGTAANHIALGTLLTRPYESVICVQGSHIDTAEAGGIERLGYKLLPVPSEDGKLRVEQLEPFLAQREDPHLTYPKVISISNVTEKGIVYSLDELGEIGKWAKEHGFFFHIDGARLANAAAHLKITDLNLITFTIGADAITLGAIKNGGMIADAVIFKNRAFGEPAARLHKQHGQLCARQHILAAQLRALYYDDLWYKNATHANKMAHRLAQRCIRTLHRPVAYRVESNAVFLALPEEIITVLKKSVDFYTWGEGVARFMCSWDTTEDDISELMTALILVCPVYYKER